VIAHPGKRLNDARQRICVKEKKSKIAKSPPKYKN
jgi:hypothetical protein